MVHVPSAADPGGLAAPEGSDDDLGRGRLSAQRRQWARAYAELSRADESTSLGPDDLEQLAMSAYLLGRPSEALTVLQRAHRSWTEVESWQPAARCAFWIAFLLFGSGELAQGGGWLGQANRHLENVPDECAEDGYVLIPLAMQHAENGDVEAALALAGQAAEIGRRTGSPDVTALALHTQGRALLRDRHAVDGLALLDESMVIVLDGDVSPPVAGVIYCSVLEACQEIAEIQRAREWTDALSSWCDDQPDMVMFTGNCLVHRAELLRMRGEWPAAMEQAEKACERFASAEERWATGAALYQQAEVLRERGEFAAAEVKYQEAGGWGHEPLPGLALLRLAQGQADVAAASVRRALAESGDPGRRARLLPACVEIELARDDVPAARAAADELTRIAGEFGTDAIRATAAGAIGAVLLAADDPQGALTHLRAGWRIWRDLNLPNHAARARVLIGLGCRALDDEEGARMELTAARGVFVQLGSAPGVAWVDGLLRAGSETVPHGLTERELEVLRLVATGRTNRSIARELTLASRTVDRHVSNIFAKLGVSSRAAATDYAHRHRLI